MTPEKLLFVGGPFDGLREDVSPVVDFVIKTIQPAAAELGKDINEAGEVVRFVYRRAIFQQSGGDIRPLSIMALEGMATRDLFAIFAARYPNIPAAKAIKQEISETMVRLLSNPLDQPGDLSEVTINFGLLVKIATIIVGMTQ